MRKPEYSVVATLIFAVSLFSCGGNDGDSGEKNKDQTSPGSSDVVSVSSVNGSGSQLDVIWTPATDPGGSSADKLVYRIYVFANGATTGVEATSVMGTDRARLSKLHSNTTYEVNVIVEDEAGNLSQPGSKLSATTQAMSFTADVDPILKTNCTDGLCHNPGYFAANIDLTAAANAVLGTLSARNISCNGLKPMIKTDGTDIIADSYLDDLLDPSKRSGNSCYSMPKDKPLIAQDYAVVYDWLVDGALP